MTKKCFFFLSIDKQLSSLPFCWLVWLLENHTAHTCHRISQLFQLRFTILSRVSLSLTHTHSRTRLSHKKGAAASYQKGEARDKPSESSGTSVW